MSTCLPIHTTIHFDIAGVNGQTNVTGGERGDEGGVTLQRQVGAVAAIRVLMLGKVVGVVHHEDGTKEGKDEGEMGGEMPKWAVKYEQLVSQVLFQRILDPAMDDGFLRHAYYRPAFYGQLSQLLDFELRNQGLLFAGVFRAERD